jgi:release factor glutamine methyltransferase
MKIRALLGPTASHLQQAGIDEARLEAELLLRNLFGLSRVELHLTDREVTADELGRLAALVERRCQREPLAYILGEQEFWSLAFTVSPAVLIPRPETELLIEQVMARIQDPLTFSGSILDLGSGSGVIPVVLARELPQARLVGVDISPAALAVAAENARRHGVDGRIVWQPSHWFAHLAAGSRYSFVVSNPPYVAELSRSTLQPELAYEPSTALFAGADGLSDLRQLIAQSPAFLESGGWLLLEIGYDQGAMVESLLQAQCELESIEIVRDYAGLDRLALARKI